jgi:xanthine dehydrogenase accessory factor
VAIAILAELVGQRTTAPPPATAIDPVCGMEVLISDATVHLEVGGERVYFCCEGCRARHAEALRA